MLTKIVQHGVVHGEILRETDPETVATIVIACLEGALMMNRLEQQNQPMLKAQKHLYSYLGSLGKMPE